MLKKENNNINKDVFTTYLISIVILVIYFVFNLIIKFVLPTRITFDIVAFLFFLLFGICLFVSLILGVINFVHNKNKNVRKKLVIMFISLIIVSILVVIIPRKLYSNLSQKNENFLVNKANEIFAKVQSDDYILLYDDLIKLDSAYSILGTNSYVKYDSENEVFVCLTYKNSALYGTKVNLKYSYYAKCGFDVENTSNLFALESYIKQNLEEKYNIQIEKVEAVISSGILPPAKIGYFYVYYNNEEYTTYVELENDKIVIKDFLDL